MADQGTSRADSADLMSIGQHCAHPECRQLDFLPFQCDACSKTFCLDHRTYQAHTCPHARPEGSGTIVCPLCARAIKLGADEDANQAWTRHQREGCDTSNYAKVHKKPRCPVSGCKEKLTTVNTYRCKDCSATVCLKHRFPADHGCEERKAAVRAASRSSWTFGFQTQQQQRQKPSAAASAARPVAQPRKPAPKPRPVQAPQPVGNTIRGTANQRRVGELPECCQACGARFATVEKLIRHAEEYHQQTPALDNRRGGDSCPYCRRQFSDPVALVSHVETAHGNGSRPSSSIGEQTGAAMSAAADRFKKWFGI